MINNVTGTINGHRLAIISNWTGPGSGNIGAIEFNNINVDRSSDAKIVRRLLEGIGKLKDSHRPWYDEDNGGVAMLFNINCSIEHLSVRNFKTKVRDERRIVRIGPSAKVEQMTLELSLSAPELRAVPIEMDAGGRIEHLAFSLDWNSKGKDISQPAIKNLGGSVGELRWINTSPKVIERALMPRSRETIQ